MASSMMRPVPLLDHVGRETDWMISFNSIYVDCVEANFDRLDTLTVQIRGFGPFRIAGNLRQFTDEWFGRLNARDQDRERAYIMHDGSCSHQFLSPGYY